MSAINDSKEIQEWYGHPPKEVGQGVYVILDVKGKLHWCPSGNNLRSCHNAEPNKYLTGPIYLSLSKEDYNRFIKWFDDFCDRW